MQKMRSALSELRLYFCNRVVSHVPSHTFRRLYYRNIMEIGIGHDVSVFMGAWFSCAGGLNISAQTVIGENCRLDARGTIEIGSQVVLAGEVTVLTADHDPRDPTFRTDRLRPVVIEDYAFVATGAMILPGVKLGKGCMVGAASVVAKNVAPFMIVAGNPAKEIGRRPENLSYQISYRRLFH